MTIQEFVSEVLPMLISILSAATGLIVTLIKTRQNSITRKVEKSVNLETKNTQKINLSKYYIIDNGVKKYLNNMQIYKEE